MDQEQLLKLLAVLRRHGWIMIQSVVTIAAAATFFAARAPSPPYVATSSLVYDVRSFDADPSVPDPSFGLADPFVRRQALVLGGSEFLELVAKNLPTETANSIRQSVKVTVDARNSLILLRSVGPDPNRPISLVTAMASTFEGSKFNDISRTLRERASELEQQIGSLETRLEKINQRLVTSKASGQDTSLLEAQQTTALGQYTSLFASQQRILNQIAVQRRPMVLLDAGTVTRAERRSPVRRGILGAMIGLVLGAGIVTLRALLDGRLRSGEQAEVITGLPVLGELPRLTRNSPRSGRARRRGRRRIGPVRRLLVLHQPNGAGAEAFRKLRTAVLFQRADHRLATLAVTSPDGSGDKTAVAANLAAAFAGSGLRTILVSADVRRSDLGSWFTIGDQPGLHELLGDWAKLKHDERFSDRFDPHGADATSPKTSVGDRFGLSDEATVDADEELVGAYLLRSPAISRLRLLPASRPPGASAERLASPDAPSLVAQLASMADLVVFDCAPTSTSDAGVVAALSDATVLVVARNSSDNRSVTRAVKQLRLAGANPIGVVITRCEMDASPVGDVAEAASRHPAATSMVRPASADPTAARLPASPEHLGSSVLRQTPSDAG